MSATLSTDTKINKDVPYGLMVAAAWSWRVIAIAVMAWVVWRVCGYVSLIIIPVIVAALLAVLMAPVYRALRRARVPGVLAALLSILLLLAVVAGLAFLAGRQLVTGFADLSAQLGQSVTQLVAWLQGLGLDLQFDAAALDNVWNTVRENSSTLLDGALAFGSTAANVLTGTFIALFTLIFFLYDGDRIWRFLLAFVPKHNRDRVDVAGRSGWESLGAFVRVQILVAAIDALGIGLGAWLLGVPLAFPLAVLVFLFSFIPMVGAFASGAIAVVIALTANGLVNGLLMVGVVVLVQQLEGNVLQPLVMGKAVSLHPLAVFLGVAAGSVAMGLVGAVFAVPLLAFINAFVQALQAKVPDEEMRAGESAFRLKPEIIEGARKNAHLDPDRDPHVFDAYLPDSESARPDRGDDERTGSTASDVHP